MKELSLNCRIAFGSNALQQLDEIENRSVFLVTDKSMVKFGVIQKITGHLKNCTVDVFDEVIPDPPIHVIASGIEEIKKSVPDIILAVGGGSVIDAAKAIRMISAKILEKEIASWEFFAIPTTSGTGSEVTDYSVISDAEKGIKYPLTSEKLRPTMAILDPELTVSVPASVTADTGMDVLTHAIEAYVSSDANDFTDALCEKAIALVFEYLPIAVKDGSDIYAREKMHAASCMAGIAFNAVGLGVNHAMAHALGGKFHVSHGRSNALFLPYTIRLNGESESWNSGRASDAAKKYQKLAKMLGLPSGGVKQAVDQLAKSIEKMNKTFGIPSTFAEQGIAPEYVDRMLDELTEIALADNTIKTNPRTISADQIKWIFTRMKGRAR